MSKNRKPVAGRWPRAAILSAGALLALSVPGANLPNALAGLTDVDPIVRIEQDWQLVLNEPGAEVTAPQFHTLISPYGSTDYGYAQATWNYRELPDFTGGGLQIQSWGADYAFGARSLREDPLSLNAETMTWTQSLEVISGGVRFRISNGTSQSWGSFGGSSAYVDLPVNVTSLGSYSSQVSKANSWITYGSNRVSYLAITQVRYYTAAGLASVDPTPVVIHQLSADN